VCWLFNNLYLFSISYKVFFNLFSVSFISLQFVFVKNSSSSLYLFSLFLSNSSSKLTSSYLLCCSLNLYVNFFLISSFSKINSDFSFSWFCYKVSFKLFNSVLCSCFNKSISLFLLNIISFIFDSSVLIVSYYL
jgi:hypothetical protein